MKADDFLELINNIDEYKDALLLLVDKYGEESEELIERFFASISRIQKSYYDNLRYLGFTEEQAFKLLLSAKYVLENAGKK